MLRIRLFNAQRIQDAARVLAVSNNVYLIEKIFGLGYVHASTFLKSQR